MYRYPPISAFDSSIKSGPFQISLWMPGSGKACNNKTGLGGITPETPRTSLADTAPPTGNTSIFTAVDVALSWLSMIDASRV